MNENSEAGGIGYRYFIVNEKDELTKISAARYQRLIKRDDNESLPGYEGSVARFVEVALELKEGEIIYINRIGYSKLLIGSDGKVDKEFQEESLRTLVETLPNPPNQSGSRVVFDAKSIFADKKYKGRYMWSPSNELMQKIIKASLE